MNDLFIGGGGYSGTIFIGALAYIHEKRLLDLKNFYGTSIGSLIGCLYISGFSPLNMISKFLDLNLEEVVKYDFNNFPSEKFIIEDSLLNTLIGFLWEKHSENISIGEFADAHNVNINIYATNITKNEYTNLNNIDYSGVKLKDALMASMSIPFLFRPISINGDMYIDGCCKNLYGSPPDDIYVHGYSMILNSISLDRSYVSEVFLSMLVKKKPRTTFLIEFSRSDSVNTETYFNLNKLEAGDILNMYKQGILFAKNTLDT